MGSRGSRHISMPNFVQIGQSIAKILRFFSRFFNMVSTTILDFQIHEILLADGVWRVRRITVPNFIKVGRSVAKILRFFEKMAAAATLDFWNHKILLANGVHRVETNQWSKFRQNRSISCEDIKIFRFFKMAAIRHFGFVYDTFGPPTESTCRDQLRDIDSVGGRKWRLPLTVNRAVQPHRLWSYV